MSERRVHSGVQSQLRASALNASFDASWDKSTKQRVALQREVSLPDTDEAFLRASFIAEKYQPENFRSSRILTRYTLGLALVYNELTVELVPASVRDSCRIQRPIGGDSSSVGEELLIGGDNDASSDGPSTFAVDLYDDSESRFRFERAVRYAFDGRGRLLFEDRSDAYYKTDDGDELVAETSGVLHFHSKDTGTTDYLMRVEKKHLGEIPLELIDHPDLRKIDYGIERAAMRNDVAFWELIEIAERDESLAKIQRHDHTRDAMAILAFLRAEVASSEIAQLLT